MSRRFYFDVTYTIVLSERQFKQTHIAPALIKCQRTRALVAAIGQMSKPDRMLSWW